MESGSMGLKNMKALTLMTREMGKASIPGQEEVFTKVHLLKT